MRLGIDVDGCLYPFDKNWNEWVDQNDYWTKWGLQRPPDTQFHAWNDYERMGISEERFLESCVEGVDAGYIFRVGSPYPLAAEVLNDFRKIGHSIHIITHRTYGKRAVQNTMEWFEEYQIGFDTITFAEDKTLVGVDLLIDDRDVNYYNSVAHGIPCVLMTREWNSHVENAPRVKDWYEFEMYVDKLAEAE